VSEQVAKAMAEGIITKSNVDIGISTTGIAGPTGGTKEKPVGLVYLAVSTKDDIKKCSKNLTGIDIVKPRDINIEYLAPGGDAGRLTIFTKSALKEIGGAE
jgi:nicotinamide mononucleotide (NMN) deamidase PncC